MKKKSKNEEIKGKILVWLENIHGNLGLEHITYMLLEEYGESFQAKKAAKRALLDLIIERKIKYNLVGTDLYYTLNYKVKEVEE